MAYRRRWLIPREALDHISCYVSYPDNPQWELFAAVHDGSVRVRYHCRELTGEDLHNLRYRRHGGPEGPWALPCDIELSLEDIERIWNDDTYPLDSETYARMKAAGFKLPSKRKRGKRGPPPGKVGLPQNRTLFPEIARIMTAQGVDATKAARILVDEGKVAHQGGSPANIAKHLAEQYRKRPRSE